MASIVWALWMPLAVALAAGTAELAEDVAAAVQAWTELKGVTDSARDFAIFRQAFAHSRWATVLNVANSNSRPNPNCARLPGICKEPFNCQKERAPRESIANADGHPDWGSWCGSPYEEGALKCQRGDLKGYGSAVRKEQLALPFIGKAVEILDSHYCFAFGHCDNTEVTPNTTLEEAEVMCDKKFGQQWRSVSHKDLDVSVTGLRPGIYGIHFDLRTETAFAKMACAMGNYHCDVIYCRQEYCHNPTFVSRYDTARPGYGKKNQLE